jgi:hypothetical protein
VDKIKIMDAFLQEYNISSSRVLEWLEYIGIPSRASYHIENVSHLFLVGLESLLLFNWVDSDPSAT